MPLACAHLATVWYGYDHMALLWTFENVTCLHAYFLIFCFLPLTPSTRHSHCWASHPVELTSAQLFLESDGWWAPKFYSSKYLRSWSAVGLVGWWVGWLRVHDVTIDVGCLCSRKRHQRCSGTVSFPFFSGGKRRIKCSIYETGSFFRVSPFRFLQSIFMVLMQYRLAIRRLIKTSLPDCRKLAWMYSRRFRYCSKSLAEVS